MVQGVRFNRLPGYRPVMFFLLAVFIFYVLPVPAAEPCRLTANDCPVCPAGGLSLSSSSVWGSGTVSGPTTASLGGLTCTYGNPLSGNTVTITIDCFQDAAVARKWYQYYRREIPYPFPDSYGSGYAPEHTEGHRVMPVGSPSGAKNPALFKEAYQDWDYAVAGRFQAKIRSVTPTDSRTQQEASAANVRRIGQFTACFASFSPSGAPPAPAELSRDLSAECGGIAIKPGDLDFVYSREELRAQLMDALKAYAKDHDISPGGGKYRQDTAWNYPVFEMFLFTDSSTKEGVGTIPLIDVPILPASLFAGYFTGHEDELGQRIAARAARTGKKLSPGDVFSESLAANDGAVFDSLLTAHNYLKAQTNGMRNGKEDAQELLKTAQDDLARTEGVLSGEGYFRDGRIIQPDPQSAAYQRIRGLITQRDRILADIGVQKRKAADNGIFDTQLLPLRTKSENAGVWYHLFITTSMAYGEHKMAWNFIPGDIVPGSHVFGPLAQRNVWLEHRLYKGIIKGQGETGIDTGKYCFDVWGAGFGEDLWKYVNLHEEPE